MRAYLSLLPLVLLVACAGAGESGGRLAQADSSVSEQPDRPVIVGGDALIGGPDLGANADMVGGMQDGPALGDRSGAGGAGGEPAGGAGGEPVGGAGGEPAGGAGGEPAGGAGGEPVGGAGGQPAPDQGIGGLIVPADMGPPPPDLPAVVVLARIRIEPSPIDLIAGEVALVTATGTYSDGHEQDLTALARFRSANAAVAAVGALRGAVREVVALGEGSTTLTATYQGLESAPARINVVGTEVVEIQLDPASVTLEAGGFQPFTARAIFNDGTNADVTSIATWRTSNVLVASVSNEVGSAGIVTAQAAGITVVTAQYSDVVSTPARVDVTNAVLQNITVTPQNPLVPIGNELALTATGRYSDGSSRDLTNAVAWASNDMGIAFFAGAPAAAGTVRGVALGLALVTARSGAITSPVQLVTVTGAVLRSLELRSDDVSIPVGTQAHFTAFGTYSDGQILDVTSTVTFLSSSPAVASIQSLGAQAGLALGLSDGTATITARSGNVVSGPIDLEVIALTLTGILVQPPMLTLALGETGQLTAIGQYNDGSSQDITAQATWQSVNPLVASVSNAPGRRGFLTTLGAGQTRISATLEGFAQLSTVTVIAPQLDRIEVDAPVASLALGGTTPLTATGFYRDGNTRDLTLQVTWSSSDEDVVIVSNMAGTRGIATALGVGATFVSARFDGVDSDPFALSVTPAEVETVEIDNVDPSIQVGRTIQLTATGTYSDGTTEDVTVGAEWNSATPNVATVSNRVGQKGLGLGVAVGVATIRAAVGAVLSAPMTLTVVPLPNDAPVPRLTCPEIGRMAEPLDFSGAGSADADGRIVAYLYDFGNGRPVIDNGVQPDISYTYNGSGAFTVSLTVEDDQGARATARCNLTILSPDAPTVRFVRPIGVRNATHGERIDALMDAQAGPGRQIRSVELLVDNQPRAVDEQAPFEATYTIPMDQANGSTVRFVARATDNAGEAALSDATLLNIVNAAPVATFVAIPIGVNEVDADASGVTDDTTPVADLQVRFDYNNDGVYERDWSIVKRYRHLYINPGDYTVRMEVRDNIGQVRSATRNVSFQAERLISGDVANDVWFGRVILTGDVRVLPNNTLTIAEGTQISVIRQDQAADGRGDYGILVNGRVLVQGTAENPVIFTTYIDNSAPNRAQRDWDGLFLQGTSPSSIAYAIIENVNRGIDIRDGSTVTNTSIRECGDEGIYLQGSTNNTITDTSVTGCSIGISASAANNLVMRRVSLRTNRSHGASISTGSFTFDASDASNNGADGLTAITTGASAITTSTFVNNATHGVELYSANVAVSASLLRANRDTGLTSRASSTGLVTHNNIIENAREGISLRTANALNPTHIVTRNNIHGNSTLGGYGYQLADTAAVLSAVSGGAEVLSGAFATPVNGTILQAEWSFNEVESGSGRVIDQNNASLITINSSSSGILVLEPTGRTSLRVGATRLSCCNPATMTVTRVLTRSAPAQGIQLSVVLTAGSINARQNYFGTYPNVLQAVRFSSPGVVDLQGFVGVPFDETWSTGPYYAGSLAADINWADTVYVSGDINVPANVTLTVAEGTTVLFAPVDQDANGLGDYGIDVSGTMNVSGVQANQVIFRPDDPMPATGDWDRIRIRAGASALNYAVIQHADVALQVESNATITRCTLRDTRSHAVSIPSGAPTFRYTTVQRAGAHGYLVAGNPTLEDSTTTESVENGIHQTGGTVTVRNSNFTTNRRHGIEVDGAAVLNVTASNFTFNGMPGIFAYSRHDAHATVTLAGSNLFGNADTDGRELGSVLQLQAGGLPLSAVSGGGEVQSTLNIAPTEAFQAYISFNEVESGQGYLRNGLTNAALASYSSSTSTWVSLDGFPGVTSIRVGATRLSCCNPASMTLSTLRTRLRGVRQVEFSGGDFSPRPAPFNLRGNYWGIFPVAIGGRIRESRANSIDFSGFVNNAIVGTGPR